MLLHRRWPVFVFATLVLPCAALDWKAENVTVTTTPFQATQDLAFAFKNRGPKPVTVLDVQTSCDCLAAQADQKTYAPGASGLINARFTIGDRAGLYERTIAVVTDDSPSPVRLTVRIEVPDTATMTPRTVTWQPKEAAGEKSIELTPTPGLEITFTEAQSTNEAFTARLETVEAGKHYRLHLKPLSTAQPASAAIRVFGREKSGHDVIISAYATVE